MSQWPQQGYSSQQGYGTTGSGQREVRPVLPTVASALRNFSKCMACTQPRCDMIK